MRLIMPGIVAIELLIMPQLGTKSRIDFIAFKQRGFKLVIDLRLGNGTART
jgi:hypothetical protein